jgi:hypothetical protein
MLDFNLRTFNSRVFPGIDPMVARLGDRVRPEARWPEVGVDIGVAQMRAIEFGAVNARQFRRDGIAAG